MYVIEIYHRKDKYVMDDKIRKPKIFPTENAAEAYAKLSFDPENGPHSVAFKNKYNIRKYNDQGSKDPTATPSKQQARRSKKRS